MSFYQFSFEDMQFAEALTKQPGRTAFIDECGSYGFDFEKEGTSSYYIVCAVIVNNKDISELEQKVSILRENYFGRKEMKSSSIGSNHPRRAKVLTGLLQLDFQLIILIADKQAFYENSPLRDYKSSFVKFLHQKLYNSMYCAYPKLKIVEDEFGRTEFQQGFRKYVCEHRPAENLFNEYDFDYVDSKHSNLVQIADIVAGSVMQQITNSEAPDALKIFRSRIVGVVNFPEVFKPYSASLGENSEFDEAVYQLAYKCATDYIEKNQDIESDEIRLRVLFLRFLLYNVQICNSTQFVYSGELVQHLSQISERRVTKDFLYRRIIAPLRDDGVIIASSVHGYKIPTSVEDIRTYINQTVTVVGPMLSRIGKCRELIKKQTDSKLDILGDTSLLGYQRFSVTISKKPQVR